MEQRRQRRGVGVERLDRVFQRIARLDDEACRQARRADAGPGESEGTARPATEAGGVAANETDGPAGQRERAGAECHGAADPVRRHARCGRRTHGRRQVR